MKIMMDVFTNSWLYSAVIILACVYNSFERMNVLFLVADDMRPELASYYGKDFPSPIHPPIKSPHLDMLAARSLLLKRAYCQQAVCSPSRTSLLTGRRPDTTHVYDLQTYWRKSGGNFTTIPEYFKQYGYTSVGMGKVFHPGKASGDDDPISWSMPYFHAPNRTWETNEYSWRAIPDDLLKDKPLVDAQTADHAVEVLRKLAPAARSGQKPFFIAVGFHRPHLPFVFPESILDLYPEESIHLPDNDYVPANMPSVAWSSYGELRNYGDIKKLNLSGAINTTVPSKVILELRRAYYSALTWTDSLVGKVIGELDRLGLSDNTVISFWGDHGWQLGEHGEWCKHTNFELATHAPMMIHIPGKTDSGIVIEKLTEFVDLFPTLVDAVGLTALPLCPDDSSKIELCREGSSLMPLIENPDLTWKNASFSQYPRYQNKTQIMGYTMRTDMFRYTEWAKFEYAPSYKPDWNDLFGVELYNHANDTEENYNVAFEPSYAKIKRALSRQLHAGWRNVLPP